jgi:hypothetical protein
LKLLHDESSGSGVLQRAGVIEARYEAGADGGVRKRCLVVNNLAEILRVGERVAVRMNFESVRKKCKK